MAVPEYTIGRGHVEVPCTQMEWVEWYGHRYFRWRNKVGPYVISTIFLGLNHGHGLPGLYYETMIISGGSNDLARYENWKQARSGHNWIVHDFRKKQRQGRLDGRINLPAHGDL